MRQNGLRRGIILEGFVGESKSRKFKEGPDSKVNISPLGMFPETVV